MPRTRDPEHQKQLGLRLRARRQWLHLSIEAVASEVGISYQQLQKYELGANDPHSALLVKLATTLSTTPAALLGDARISTNADGSDSGMVALLADAPIASMLRRLRKMTDDQRRHAHALICTIEVA